MLTPRELAGLLDQTLLKPEIGPAGYRAWIERSRGQGFASLCIPPAVVPLATTLLEGDTTAVCTVVGFPLGYSTTLTKVEEARRLVGLGASEIDMVIGIGLLAEDVDELVESEIRAVVEGVREVSGGSALVKVILENAYLTAHQIRRGSEAAVRAGADFVKTSTGFGPCGARVEDVRIMRETVGTRAGVKAAGGIRDLETARAMIAAGASRIGTSAGLEIVVEAELDAARSSDAGLY